ncbi:DUF1800 domain-containing protein [Mesorhizobium sp. M9A.F.Ca.ET.002.03.1.2]|uniref:DUF1800 domain-containing protein n=1 Tax=Mesorhizobium sp. M9A.F.Ca.ET.002.03.1.2 TaxID=2493668 RepID=UPI001FE1BECF|nr:DUF1800 domain-containing protein [Mesorhizobium sp. M9A.F.Ca.ET.002.03.1.2]
MARPSEVAVALNRFGLGARPEDEAPADPKSWLLAQFESYDANPAVFSGAPDSATLGDGYAETMLEAKGADADAKMAARKTARQEAQALYRDEVDMRARAALATSTPFVERLVHFWSNHFAISAEKPQLTLIAGAFEREAIRPHVLGRFEDMLLAAVRHPAMLLYLDQVRSIGPNSRFANRAAKRGGKRKPGINENLAREIMELHTLGVRSGYSQADVTEFALALTGFSTGRARERDQAGAFTFRPGLHEPGERTIMGKTYDQSGKRQALAVLGDLAAAEATATHIAAKLARHFIADEPPAAVVTRLAEAFRRSKGDLVAVYHALIDSPEAWQPAAAKFKTPWEWTISALRGLGRSDIGKPRLAPLLNQLGQPVWRPRSPAGYDDVAGSWAAPDALVRRVEAAQRLAAQSDDVDPRDLARKLFAGSLNELTVAEVDRAESRRTGIALLLVSPDFQRR